MLNSLEELFITRVATVIFFTVSFRKFSENTPPANKDLKKLYFLAKESKEKKSVVILFCIIPV